MADGVPECREDVVRTVALQKRRHKNVLQMRRRAAKRLGIGVGLFSSAQASNLAPHRISTIHVVTAALAAWHWTGQRHYPEQTDLLQIMGVFKGTDFVRDRVDYLRKNNPDTFDRIQQWATALRRR